MMKRMSEVFELPLECDWYKDDCVYDQSGEDSCPVFETENTTKSQVEAIVHAVNSHDDLVSKLDKAVELLGEFNVVCSCPPDNTCMVCDDRWTRTKTFLNSIEDGE